MKRFLLIRCLSNAAFAGPEEANALRRQRQWKEAAVVAQFRAALALENEPLKPAAK